MKKVTTFFLLISALAFVGCEKESAPDCTKATVRFNNTSTNPYNLYIDGAFKKKLGGNTFTEYDLTEGQHTAKAEQVSGYLFFPTIVNKNLTVFGCQEQEWIFP